MTQPPNSDQYFSDLQKLAETQDKAKLSTLAIEFQSTIDKFQAVRTEVDAYLNSSSPLDYLGIVQRLEPQLVVAAEFVDELSYLPEGLASHPSVKEFLEGAFRHTSSRLVSKLPIRLKSLCDDIQEAARLAQEKVEAERKAKEKAEAKRIAKAQAEAKRKAQEAARLKEALPEMIRIPAGLFTMGGKKGRDGSCDNSEKPLRTLTVPEFFMSKYLITFQQFDAYCALVGSNKPNDSGWGRGLR